MAQVGKVLGVKVSCVMCHVSYLLPTSFQEVENTVDCSNQSKRNRKT